MEAFIHIDSIYINVKYPKSDIYNHWVRFLYNVDHRTLKEGIVLDDLVIRTGASGYKFSIWKGDIRAFLTPDTDDVRGDGNGMGIWLQLGPKFINANGWEVQEGVLEFIKRIGVNGEYDANVTRLDLAIDLLGLDIDSLKHEDFLLNWAGRSELKNTHTEKSRITGFDIGSRKSAVYLRIYDKIKQAQKINELGYWFDVWGNPYTQVTRCEWEVKPKEGNFPEYVTNFYKLNQESIKHLIDYLLDWGRLAIPNENDQVKSRWADSPFWKELRKAIKSWNPEELERLKRIRNETTEFSDRYAQQLAGTLAGGMARANPDNPNYVDLMDQVNKHVSISKIKRNANNKAKRIKALTQQIPEIEGE